MSVSVNVIIVFLAIILGTGYFAYPKLSVIELENFLNYVTDIGNDRLASELDGRDLGDFQGSADLYIGDMVYNITRLKITKYVKPTSSVVVHRNFSVAWALEGADVDVNGFFGFEFEGDIIEKNKQDEFDINIGGISLRYTIGIGFNRVGLLTVKLPFCSCDIDNTVITVEGWLYNQIKHNFEDGIEEQFKKQICGSIYNTVWYIGMVVSSITAIIILIGVRLIYRARQRPIDTR